MTKTQNMLLFKNVIQQLQILKKSWFMTITLTKSTENLPTNIYKRDFSNNSTIFSYR